MFKCSVVLMYAVEVLNVYQCSLSCYHLIFVCVMFFAEHLCLAHEINLVSAHLKKQINKNKLLK